MIKIGFFGNSNLSAFCLNGLMEDYDVSFIVTGEDKRAGRGRKNQSIPVKQIAEEKNIPLFQPINLHESNILEAIKKIQVDIFVIVAYGKIIPEKVFTIPPLNAINLHPSLLPKYRGAAPVQWALINGEKTTGITVQLINKKLDAGDIILQQKIDIEMDMTAGDLYHIILPTSVNLLKESIKILSSGKNTLTKQNEADATYCNKINRETAQIKWNKSSISIHNLVRGLNPYPSSWTIFRKKNLKILKTIPFNEELDIHLKPGYLKKFQKKKLLVGSGNGNLEILQIQPEAKKIMDATPFINGYRIIDDDHFD